jgi:hypothetical protein
MDNLKENDFELTGISIKPGFRELISMYQNCNHPPESHKTGKHH